MRIRSIKPEFWTSEDVAALDWDTRLIFIGLWSYVDDNGVGRDVERLIVADLFPLEDDPRDTLARVHRGLASLAAAGLITRYTVDSKPYLHICTWNAHQKIDRPAKERYPLPTCGNAVIRDTLATPSRESRDTLATGTGEQGNRGTGEQGIASAPRSTSAAALAATTPAPTVTATVTATVTDDPADDPVTSDAVVPLFDGPPPTPTTTHAANPVQILVGAYDQEVKRRGGTASKQHRSRIGAATKRLLAEGIPEPVLLAAVMTAASRGRADLDSILAAPNGPQNARGAERTRMFARWDAIAEQFDGRQA